jgi:type II secretory pathway component PulF
MQIGTPKRKTDMKRVEVLLFVSELADLLEAGMTLGQALQALANQGEEDSARRYICQELCDCIVRGETFSGACARHPKTFPPLFSNMLRAGEASGAMIEVLRRLGDHYERDDNMRGKIKGALTYPVIVLCFGILAVIGALVWIIPQFQKVFDSMGAALPLPTRILIGMSDALINYGWAMALGVGVIALWFKKWRKTVSGIRKIDTWKLKAPLIKGIVASGAYSSLAYTLKTLLSNGVNVLQALKICEETCGNAVIGDALATARKRVTDGTTISGPLAASGVFPKMMTDMLAVGEQAGDMASSLENVGRRYQKEMDRNIAAFTNALEPILIVGIAGVVGFVAIAILTAVFKVSSSIG